MNLKINKIKLSQSKDVDNFKMMVASNMHYNQKFKFETFDSLEEVLIAEKPNCLIIPGGLVDKTNKEYDDLYDFLFYCSELTKVIIAFKETDFLDRKFLADLKTLLFLNCFKENNDESYHIGNVSFYGYIRNSNLNVSKEKQTKLFEFGILDYLLSSNINKDAFNVLVTNEYHHILNNKKEYQNNILQNIDLILSNKQKVFPLNNYRDLGNSTLITSKGINSNIPLNKPEIDIIKIKKLKK